MEKLSALLLSAALLFGAVSLQNSDSDALSKLSSLYIRIFQAATAAPKPDLEANIATVASSANLYSSYNQNTPTLAQLRKGDRLHILRKAVFSSTEWVYVCAGDYNVCGWVLVSELNMPNVVENEDLGSGDIVEEYTPNRASMGIVSSDQLNIRTAPGTGFDRIGAYRAGDRVGIIETNSGWGRTAKGWIYLDYVYLDGQVGENPMVGNVTADQLNVRTGPGTKYPVRNAYRRGDRLLILTQIYTENAYWGCTNLGWVNMNYVQPDYIPGTNQPIYGYGTVKDSAMYIYPSANTGYTPSGVLYQGMVVPILQTAMVDGYLWGHVDEGWVVMSCLDMRAIFHQNVVPEPPVDKGLLKDYPTEPPVEHPTEVPTEAPTEVPTETPTEAPTEAPTEPIAEIPTDVLTQMGTDPTAAPG